MNIKLRNGYIAIYSEKLIRFFTITAGKEIREKAKAVVPFPFVIVFRSEEFEIPHIVLHEKIHFRQALELLYIGTFILKFAEKFYARSVLKKSRFETYLYTAIEQEAYLNQNNPDYLHERKFWAVFKYIRNKKDFVPDQALTGRLIYKNRRAL